MNTDPICHWTKNVTVFNLTLRRMAYGTKHWKNKMLWNDFRHHCEVVICPLTIIETKMKVFCRWHMWTCSVPKSVSHIEFWYMVFTVTTVISTLTLKPTRKGPMWWTAWGHASKTYKTYVFCFSECLQSLLRGLIIKFCCWFVLCKIMPTSSHSLED